MLNPSRSLAGTDALSFDQVTQELGVSVIEDPLANTVKQSYEVPAGMSEVPSILSSTTGQLSDAVVSQKSFMSIFRSANATERSPQGLEDQPDKDMLENSPAPDTEQENADKQGLSYFKFLASQYRRSQCTEVHFIFARGTGELQGFGVAGAPIDSRLKSTYTSYSSHAVVYPASASQNSASGSREAEAELLRVIRTCPSTKIILGGYSQGASVIHAIKTTAQVKQNIRAVLFFGDPYLNFAKPGLNNLPITDAAQIFDACNALDPVCGLANANTLGRGVGHLGYVGTTTTAAAMFAIDKLR